MLKNSILMTVMATVVFGTACSQDGSAEQDATVNEKVEEAVTPKSADMTPVKMAEIISKFDKDADVESNRITFQLRERDMFLVFDENADRMRIVTGVYQAGAIPEEIHARMLQANFDAVLDARYAIANDIVWAVFIHRMSSLTEEDLRSGIAQTYTAAETFGTSYTSGAIVFGGGDSSGLHEELLEELENAPTEEDQDI